MYHINWRDTLSRGILTKAELAVIASMLPFIGWQSNHLLDDITKRPFNTSTLAKAINYDVSSLRKLLAGLERKGFITIEKQGIGKPSNFLLNPNIAPWGGYVNDEAEFDAFIGKQL